MRIFRYSWDSKDTATVEINVDRTVVKYLIQGVKVEIKNAVNDDNFEKAKEYFKDLEVLISRLEKLDELEQENDNQERPL